MERRRLAVCLLAPFIALTVLATVLAGSRPATDEGWAPWALQIAGYLVALAAGVLLLTVPGRGDHRPAGFVVVGVVVVLSLLDALSADEDGANIGAGLVRRVCLGAVVAVMVRIGAAAISGGRRA